MCPLYEHYLDFLAAREKADGSVTHGIGNRLSYRAWILIDYTSTCYYDRLLMARFAELLVRNGSRYARKDSELRNLINSKYYDVERALYATGLQTTQQEANWQQNDPADADLLWTHKMAYRMAAKIEGSLWNRWLEQGFMTLAAKTTYEV